MKYGFIGTGNMGGALATAIARGENAEVLLYDKDMEKAKALAAKIGAKAVAFETAVQESHFLFIGVKPYLVKDVLAQVNDALNNNRPVIVSMAAAITVAQLSDMISLPVIRILPNTPALVGKGLALAAKNTLVTDEMTDAFLAAMAPTGETLWMEENIFDGAGTVTSCGPAFAYMFMESLADGGVYCGVPRDKAMRYAQQMLLGTAALAKETGAHPGAIKDSICSPGGTTIAGVLALEAGGFRSAAMDAVIAAYERTLELKK